MIRSPRLLITIAFACTAAPLAAQQVARPEPTRDLLPRPAAEMRSAPVQTPALTQAERQTAQPITPRPAGPRYSAASAGVRTTAPASSTLPAAPRHDESNRPMAMMIVGGAALIAGAIIGDTPGTIIMVGGVGLGLFGLYKYLE